MAKQLLDRQGILPSKFSSSHAPQFQGGQVDAASGNVMPAGSAPASQQAQAQEVGDLEPAQPTTRLGDMSMEEPDQPGALQQIGAMAAPKIGSDIGTGLDAGKPLGQATSDAMSNITSFDAPGGKPGMGDAKQGPVLGATSAPPIGTPITGNPWSGVAPGWQSAGPGVSTWAGPAGANPWGGAAPAASSAASSAPSMGGGFGALGAGIGTFAGGLLMGQKPKDAAIAGVGSGIGYAIGSMFGPVGSFVGSFLGGLFCHAAGTKIRMADYSWKNIEDLRVGDVVALGGAVMARGEALTLDLYTYKDVLVDGHHAVFEDGKWLRAKDSALAERVTCEEPVMIYPVVTEQHLLALETHIAADLAEIDEDLGGDERLERLNANTDRNEWLRNYSFGPSHDETQRAGRFSAGLRLVASDGQRSAPV